MAALLLTMTDGPDADRVLTDKDVAAANSGTWDKAKMMNTRRRLGLHNGVPVIAEYPCSDLCPSYTLRIVHYDVAAGPLCKAAGGVTRTIMVPQGIAIGPRDFCLPRPIAQTGTAARP